MCQAFPDTFPAQSKIVTTGNPVRKEITEIFNPSWRYQEREKSGQPLRVLIVGGSLGARALNECVPVALQQLGVPLKVFHQCGQNNAEATQALYAHAPDSMHVDVSAFIEDMAQAYAEADLIICRAGALTVTEIATAGLAAVFVPLPSAVDDHQTANAKFLADMNAAKICPQAEMTPDSLAKLLKPLMNRQLLQEMAVKARQQAQPDAAQHVVRLIQEL